MKKNPGRYVLLFNLCLKNVREFLKITLFIFLKITFNLTSVFKGVIKVQNENVYTVYFCLFK